MQRIVDARVAFGPRLLSSGRRRTHRAVQSGVTKVDECLPGGEALLGAESG